MALLGSCNALAADFADALDGIRDGSIPSAAMNTHRGKLADLPELLPGWIPPENGVIKAIVEL